MSVFTCSKTDFFGLYKRASFDSTGRVVFRKKEKSAIEKARGFQSPNQIFYTPNYNINPPSPPISHISKQILIFFKQNRIAHTKANLQYIKSNFYTQDQIFNKPHRISFYL